MIGKITIGKSFSGCISYCLEDKKQSITEELKQELVHVSNRAELLEMNMCFGTKKELIRQFNEVRWLNSKVSKPVMHISLSFSPEDKLKAGGLNEMIDACARQMGFEKNQFIAVMHKDTKHQHLHIVVNRIGFDGKTLSDSNNYLKISKYCREMEQQHLLKQVLSPKRFLSEKEQLLERNDQRKQILKEHIADSIKQSVSVLEFQRRMEKLGYEVIRGRGIAFRDKQKVYAKGSELGFSLSVIEKKLQLRLALENKISVEQKQLLKLERQLKLKIEGDTKLPQSSHEQKRSIVKEELVSQSEAHRHRHREEELLEVIMNPIEDSSEIPYELKHKRRLKIW